MFDFFERLRKKTRRERQIFALVSSLSVTLFIFGLWAFLTLPENLSSVTEEKKSSVTPIANIKKGFEGAFKSISKEFSDLKEKLSSSFDQEFVAPDTEKKDFKNTVENDKLEN
ncbi:MAG: hypothetical protein AAB534_00545 [Patescibacteria group bacterium]